MSRSHKPRVAIIFSALLPTTTMSAAALPRCKCYTTCFSSANGSLLFEGGRLRHILAPNKSTIAPGMKPTRSSRGKYGNLDSNTAQMGSPAHHDLTITRLVVPLSLREGISLSWDRVLQKFLIRTAAISPQLRISHYVVLSGQLLSWCARRYDALPCL
jgi:hypothetical protein